MYLINTIEPEIMKLARLGELIIWVDLNHELIMPLVMFLMISYSSGSLSCFMLVWYIFLKLRQNSGKMSRRTYILHIQLTLLLILQVKPC
jgi:hypothetical protein